MALTLLLSVYQSVRQKCLGGNHGNLVHCMTLEPNVSEGLAF